MSIQAVDWQCAGDDDRSKPRNVVRPLPALSRDALMIAAYEEARADPSLRLEAKCESSEVADGYWHVVAAIPGQEMIAAAHLIARRAAIYLPLDEGKPFVPGYVFVFAWGVDFQWRKILSAPGVGGVLASGERMRPIPDKVIDELRAREALCEVSNLVAQTKTGGSRSGWRRRSRREDADDKHQVVANAWVTVIDMLEDAPHEQRSGLFATALGL